MPHDIGPNRLKLPHFLPYRLATVSNRISRTIARMYVTRFDLTIPEWRIMAVLGDEPDISASDVADRTAMDKVAVSRAVSRLLKSGRIERHFAPEDRRRSVLALSDKGRDIYRQIMPLALQYETALIAELTKEEESTLDRLLSKLEGLKLEQLRTPD